MGTPVIDCGLAAGGTAGGGER